jgi:hypothetical protein
MDHTHWRLADYYQPIETEEEWAIYPIRSQEELRGHLHRLARQAPRVVELYPPADEFLRIGIGGQWAGLALIELPSLQITILMPPVLLTEQSVEFMIQGQPSTWHGDELHSPETLIELICNYYTHGRFPDGLDWRE